MDNEDSEQKKDNSENTEEKKAINVTPQTPIRVDEFTLADIFDSDTIRTAITALLGLMTQSVENDKANNEIEKKKLENEIELRKLDIKEQELDLQGDKQEQGHIKWFDIRNKLYTFGMLLAVIFATVVLKGYDILDKNEARTIIIIALTIGMTSNTDLIKKLFSNKRDD